MKHRIYLASSWRNKYQPGMVELLRGHGHEVYDFRHPSPDDFGFQWMEIDPEWEEWDVFQYRKALRSPIAEDGFQTDMNALKWAEVVVLLLPSGRSSHSEAAWHKGKDGVVIVHSPEPCEPELMYKMFNAITATEQELLELLDIHISQLKELRLTAAAETR